MRISTCPIRACLPSVVRTGNVNWKMMADPRWIAAMSVTWLGIFSRGYSGSPMYPHPERNRAPAATAALVLVPTVHAVQKVAEAVVNVTRGAILVDPLDGMTDLRDRLALTP